MVSEFNKWDDRTKAFELTLSLRDDAQVTLSDLKPEERKNFKSIVAALTSRFEPEDQSELYRSELKNSFRKKDEPLTEFAQDIKRLVRLAYPNTDVVGWLVVLGFNGPLRQYFSLYRAVSKRGRKKRKDR